MIALPFLKSASPSLQGERLYLRAPQIYDYRAWANLRAQSRDFLTPWEPLWADDDLERSSFRHRIRHYDEEAAAGTAHPFFLFHNSDSRLLGGITLGNIRRGVGQNGMIGYWTGAPYAGQGFMREALGLLITHAFTKVRLHRLEAACIPSNERSIRLLEKAGFQREGLLRSYLKINGMWQDHLLFSMIEDDVRR
ncbi:GNAT family N-acetyltransferase [Phyllobacterium sp. 628]|uniref:GNAT family N-acetyltransferase n=1 Tax=Phyllobacterium sp. 628 TaxID=2718938 RepID=UPI0016626567|nr:GNAT family protein [Phyllobacterium sp. 628]QND52227.1 GNAT family N-acetyltransferase [Phyllobacterium sp. 628]